MEEGRKLKMASAFSTELLDSSIRLFTGSNIFNASDTLNAFKPMQNSS